MYERFTDRARKVMQLANQEAQRFNHEYITEHVLLGLIKEGSGVAANVLKNPTSICARSGSRWRSSCRAARTWSRWASCHKRRGPKR
jgi:ATP-dependent Clp protease ATP-binding subunit ClpA